MSPRRGTRLESFGTAQSEAGVIGAIRELANVVKE